MTTQYIVWCHLQYLQHKQEHQNPIQYKAIETIQQSHFPLLTNSWINWCSFFSLSPPSPPRRRPSSPRGFEHVSPPPCPVPPVGVRRIVDQGLVLVSLLQQQSPSFLYIFSRGLRSWLWGQSYHLSWKHNGTMKGTEPIRQHSSRQHKQTDRLNEIVNSHWNSIRKTNYHENHNAATYSPLNIIHTI